MYQNTDNLKVGNDYYNLTTGEYGFSYVYDGDERLHVQGIPETMTGTYYSGETYETDVYAYVKGSNKLLDEDEVANLCYNDVYVDKNRLDELSSVKSKIEDIIKESKVTEPFVYENGELSVGKEHVLSAHIQAGYDQGWISSSICW